MADLLYRTSIILVPRLFVLLTRLWFTTLRVQCSGLKHREEVSKKGAAIAVFWHYSFVYLFHHLRKFPSAVMVSASRDGEYIARVAELMGHFPIRGSSNQFGMRALRSGLKAVKEGRNLGLVADGSQGPPRKAQAGCILAASKSGAPIVPIIWAANRYFSFNSWDKTIVPYPFAKIVLRYGAPLYIPDKLTSEQVEEYRRSLEKTMNELYNKVWEEVGREPHDIN